MKQRREKNKGSTCTALEPKIIVYSKMYPAMFTRGEPETELQRQTMQDNEVSNMLEAGWGNMLGIA